MPEGPSIVILREEAAGFEGKRILRVEGNTTIEKERLLNQDIFAGVGNIIKNEETNRRSFFCESCQVRY